MSCDSAESGAAENGYDVISPDRKLRHSVVMSESVLGLGPVGVGVCDLRLER
jgi:hypothetical protein